MPRLWKNAPLVLVRPLTLITCSAPVGSAKIDDPSRSGAQPRRAKAAEQQRSGVSPEQSFIHECSLRHRRRCQLNRKRRKDVDMRPGKAAKTSRTAPHSVNST